ISWNIENTWAIENSSVREAGCIHTAQGLEFDYVGVIIGDDMRFEDGEIITDFTKRAKTDQSLRGIKGFAKEDLARAHELADPIIRNTYRTLMTRGQKGCFVFCTDTALQKYLAERLERVMLYRKERENMLYLVDGKEVYEE
ncbi:DNA/RNA helicase domain-containing protein, partial [Sporosarcina sp. NCCP-2222]|uniref:DNA/RNA helicase domain-containing protein n=1 Tax=Sporosarcina sp. NCCP-2222 TaxID=2935073 RepID=UPI0020BE6A1B